MERAVISKYIIFSAETMNLHLLSCKTASFKDCFHSYGSNTPTQCVDPYNPKSLSRFNNTH